MTTPAKRAEQLAALPSLSHALSSLPQARSLDHVALHHPTLAQRGPESEAKVAIRFLSFFLHPLPQQPTPIYATSPPVSAAVARVRSLAFLPPLLSLSPTRDAFCRPMHSNSSPFPEGRRES